MSTSSPNATFIYPPPKPIVSGGEASPKYNYIDTVNVSWTGDNPELFTTQLVLCENVPPGCGLLSLTNVSEIGWIGEVMNQSTTYPFTARFNLRHIYPNGTNLGILDSVNFLVYQDEGLQPVTWSAANIAVSTTTSTSPTPGPSMTTNALAATPSSATPSSATQSSGTTLPGITSSATPSSATSSSAPSSSPSGGTIAGAVVGAVVGLLLLIAVVLLIGRRLRQRKLIQAQRRQQQQTSPGLFMSQS